MKVEGKVRFRKGHTEMVLAIKVIVNLGLIFSQSREIQGKSKIGLLYTIECFSLYGILTFAFKTTRMTLRLEKFSTLTASSCKLK